MTPAEIARQIARCDQEIAAMENQPPKQPAYLTTLGIEDWKAERRLLEQMRADTEGEVMITANFHNLTEREAQHVMETLDGLISAVKAGHVHIQIRASQTLEEERANHEAMYARLEQLTRPAAAAHKEGL